MACYLPAGEFDIRRHLAMGHEGRHAEGEYRGVAQVASTENQAWWAA
jgi:hypothetical protein